MATHYELDEPTVAELRAFLQRLEAEGDGDLLIEHITRDGSLEAEPFCAASVYYSGARRARVVQLV